MFFAFAHSLPIDKTSSNYRHSLRNRNKVFTLPSFLSYLLTCTKVFVFCNRKARAQISFWHRQLVNYGTLSTLAAGTPTLILAAIIDQHTDVVETVAQRGHIWKHRYATFMVPCAEERFLVNIGSFRICTSLAIDLTARLLARKSSNEHFVAPPFCPQNRSGTPENNLHMAMSLNHTIRNASPFCGDILLICHALL